MKNQLIFVALAVLVTLGATIKQGVMSDRWAQELNDQLLVFSSHLDQVFDPDTKQFVDASAPAVPRSFGKWFSQDVSIPLDQFEASGCHGVVSRVYKHAETGEEVTIFLVSGKAYHVTIHTPDWCYVAAGYEMEKSPSNYSFELSNGKRPDVLNAMFKKQEPTRTTRLRILWTYSDDGNWVAPKLAKHSFAGKPAMYKIYFITNANGEVPKMGDDPTVKFAKEFLPLVEPILFEAAPAPAADELAAG